jgi:hypothetical protein
MEGFVTQSRPHGTKLGNTLFEASIQDRKIWFVAEKPIIIGDLIQFVGNRTPPPTAQSAGTTAKSPLLLADLPAKHLPTFRATASEQMLVDFIRETFNGGSEVSATRAKAFGKPVKAEEIVQQMGGKYEGGASAYMLKIACEYITHKSNANISSSIKKLTVKGGAVKKRGPLDAIVKSSGKNISPIEKLFLDACDDIQNELTPRQFELLTARWIDHHLFRQFRILGLTTKEISGCMRDPLFMGLFSTKERRSVLWLAIHAGITTASVSGKQRRTPVSPTCLCEGRKDLAWCILCRATYHHNEITPVCIQNLFEALCKFPLAFSSIPYDKAIRILEAESEDYQNPVSREDAICGRFTRKLSASTSTCIDISSSDTSRDFPYADESSGVKDEELKAKAICMYGIIPTVSKIGTTYGKTFAYLAQRLWVENCIASFLVTIASEEVMRGAMEDVAEPPRQIGTLTLSEEQFAAASFICRLYAVPQNCVVSITGGPGVGKTTILKSVIRYFYDRKVSFRFTAFTGKAVMRVRESTRAPRALCSTIDRLIMKGDVNFEVLIIDEASMMSSELFYRFLQERKTIIATAKPLKIILVGDADQLFPIDWGSPFVAVLEHIKTFRLNECYRVKDGGGSEKLLNLHRLLRSGQFEKQSFTSDAPIVQIHAIGKSNDDKIAAEAEKIIDRLMREHGAKPKDIGVLTPYKRIAIPLNVALRKKFVDKDAIEDAFQKQVSFAVGDRVICRRNLYLKLRDESTKADANGMILLPSGHCIPNGIASIYKFIVDLRLKKYGGFLKIPFPNRVTDEEMEQILTCVNPTGCRMVVEKADECEGCEEVSITKACSGQDGKTSSGLSIMNGEIGTVEETAKDFISVRFDSSPEHLYPFHYRIVQPQQQQSSTQDEPILNKDAVSMDRAIALIEATSGNEIVSSLGELNVSMLQTAFALTIHLSQGSEFNHIVVVVPSVIGMRVMDSKQSEFLTRNLIYTALTRAKETVSILFLGPREAFARTASVLSRALPTPRQGFLLARAFGVEMSDVESRMATEEGSSSLKEEANPATAGDDPPDECYDDGDCDEYDENDW